MSVDAGRVRIAGDAIRMRRGRRSTRTNLRPGMVVLVMAGAAWVVLVLAASPLAGGAGAHPGHGIGSAWQASSTTPATVPVGATETWSTASAATWAAGWLLMVVAMMWPLLAPAVDRVAESAFPRWRIRLVVVTIAVPTALWVVFGMVAGVVAGLVAGLVGDVWWQLAALALAAIALRSARRARLLARCSVRPPVAPGGRRGIRDAARAGLVEWRRCALLCGPLMLAMAVGHGLLVLVPASLAVWWEARHPRAFRDRVPLALVVVAALGATAQAVLAA